jgi:N-acetyl-gamma-glutamyl-phosphate reductase
MPEGRFPETAQVLRTNLCLVGVGECAGTTVLVSALDNLVKGAAGQAVQNMNAALGFPETAGLTEGVPG